MYVNDRIVIDGQSQRRLTIGTTGAQTVVPQNGVYDVWCDVDVWLSVRPVDSPVGDRAQDVTTDTGYRLSAGNVVSMGLDAGKALGAVALGTSVLRFHKVG